MPLYFPQPSEYLLLLLLFLFESPVLLLKLGSFYVPNLIPFSFLIFIPYVFSVRPLYLRQYGQGNVLSPPSSITSSANPTAASAALAVWPRPSLPLHFSTLRRPYPTTKVF